MTRRLLVVLTFVLFTAAAWAQGSEWQIDPNHTTVAFTVRHMGISNVHGHFGKVSGSANIDDSDMTKSSVNATIDTASVDTGVQMRDNDLRSPNYFDAQQFPTITFKSKSVTKNGDKLKIVGDLTIHGVTKEVTLDVDGPSAPIKQGPNQRRGLEATTSINRKDFGVGSKATAAMVGEEIKIQIDAELTQKGAPAQ
ncbi:MAG: YceI family protein [Acidobacteria bacterium]|nr:YceI family protein [Acidobacteriota bacterium]MBV9148009.1 YceI family protein [Acidobacteriota bacterium]MBV9436133.1 YceI family protein [Acidobacteriota bacterium]